VLDGVPVTTPPRTLVDLAAWVRPQMLEQAIAEAERSGLAELDDVAAVLERGSRARGAPLLRRLIMGGRPAFTRSAAEERFLALIRKGGLPSPETNVPVGGTEVDFLWRSERVVVEVDGFAYHSSRRAFESDRRRDARLASLGLRIVRLETFLARAEEADPLGYGVPGWVERDFRAYLRCGIPAHGFARVRCGDCGQERLLPFSCKGRGVCPSCNARRMADVAARLTDHVLPHLPLRQWVLSVPKRLRPYLHHDVRLAGLVLRTFVRVIRSELRGRCPGAPADARIAAVSFPQRFGSSLNPHFHYHVLAIDGVFSEEPYGKVRFHEATRLLSEHAHEVARTVQRRVLRAFRQQEILDDATVADMLDWQATGGFSVDGSVRIEGDDRAGVERLVRYCARPPFALERLHAVGDVGTLASEDARLVYRLPEPDLHGLTELVLTPIELLERISRLIPPPRVHRHRYHGVLAPNARFRPAVVAIGRDAPETDTPEPADVSPPAAGHSNASGSEHSRPVDPPTARSRACRLAWALLLARIYEILPLLCPGTARSVVAAAR
jgi:hypothetical protein